MAQTDREAGTLEQTSIEAVEVKMPADMAIQGEPCAPTPEPSAEERLAEAVREKASKLAPAVEALLVSSPRAIPPRRLAQALGLIAPDEPLAPAENVPAPEAPAGSEPLAEAPKPKRAPRRRKATADQPDPEEVIKAAVASLNLAYEQTARSFRIEAVAGGYRLMTLPQFGQPIAALQGAASQSKLSRPGVETLAIIAYRQPVTRAQLEAIRGVACGEVIKTLLDRRLITIAGRAEELGRPLLYATTKQFLAAFGLSSIKDLPAPGELGLKG